MSGNLRRRPKLGIWIARVGLLAGAILAIVLISRRYPQTGEEPPAKAVAVSEPAPPGTSIAPEPPPVTVTAPAGDDFPPSLPGPAASVGSLDLPVQAGAASLDRIGRFIREDQLPAREIVRIEEMLEHFLLRPLGSAAIAQGVTLSTETLACPWKPSATLLLVSFRGAAGSSHEVKATFTPDPAAVRRYRLLGFERADRESPLPSTLAAGRVTTLAIEVETSATDAAFGSIAWTVDGRVAAPLSLFRQPDAEPSDDARFAALVCTYGQWLAGEQSAIIDEELLAALARELASVNLPAERAELLVLIDRSLKL